MSAVHRDIDGSHVTQFRVKIVTWGNSTEKNDITESRSRGILEAQDNFSSTTRRIKNAMFNRDTKLVFWIVHVICAIFPTTKGQFARVSLRKLIECIV